MESILPCLKPCRSRSGAFESFPTGPDTNPALPEFQRPFERKSHLRNTHITFPDINQRLWNVLIKTESKAGGLQINPLHQQLFSLICQKYINAGVLFFIFCGRRGYILK